jgi:DNA-directed RNA polymerase subunit RPC12/RpoP
VNGILEEKINTKNYHLILITDGEIEVNGIDECDAAIIKNNINFGFVSVFIIGRNISMNLSVQAAFCRNCGSRVIVLKEDKLYKEVEPEVVISAEDHALLNTISNINTFDELTQTYDGLIQALTARVIGKKGDRYD